MSVLDYTVWVLAIGLTLLVAVGAMLCIKLIWDHAVAPILYNIKESRENRWEHKYWEISRKLDYYQGLVYKFGIRSKAMADHIYSIIIERKEELNEAGRLEMRVSLEIEPEEE